jgi:hypothetical protein
MVLRPGARRGYASLGALPRIMLASLRERFPLLGAATPIHNSGRQVPDAMQPTSFGFLWGLDVGVDEDVAVVNSFISSCTIDERPMQSSNSFKVSCRLVRTSHTTSSCTFPTLILCCCFLFWHFNPLPSAGAGCHSTTPEQRPASLGDASGRAIFTCRLAVAQFRSMLRGQS